MRAGTGAVQRYLVSQGIAHVRGPLDRAGFLALAGALGKPLGAERIALRPGAHAYVAKPGPVPFHTDHPDVGVIGWWCERQDEVDGASRLLDTRPITMGLPAESRSVLEAADLWCPPLAGGPPTERRPALRVEAGEDAIFLPPWLLLAEETEERKAALELVVESVRVAAESAVVEIRLQPGEALFADNRRMLHGRRAIGERSGRALQRVWVDWKPAFSNADD
jgi:hypothetical protein